MAVWKKSKTPDFGLIQAAGIIALVVIIGAIFIVAAPKEILPSAVVGVSNIEYFTSYEEMVAYFKSAQGSSSGRYDGGLVPMGGIAENVIKATGVATSTSPAPSVSGSTDFSTTNIQVEGVDEADIVKTDGKYAYIIAGDKLYIVDAYPAENSTLLSTITFDEGYTPSEMFIKGDKVLVFANKYSYGGYYGGYYDVLPATKVACVDCVSSPSSGEGSTSPPQFGSSGIVAAFVYNVSDRSSPVKEKEVEFEGSYLSSRMIGSYAYFVVNNYPNIYYYTYAEDGSSTETVSDSIIPEMRIDGVVSDVAPVTEIGFIPDFRPQSFVTIASLNLDTMDVASETVAASSQNIYASQNNLYLADITWVRDENTPLPLQVLRSIYVPNWASTEKTSVAKFKLENGNALFVAEGLVPGHILNQFSMDEYDNHFRIATTVGEVWGEGASQSRNNIYVLGPDMNIVGTLEDLAPGEKIYSSRFMGAKGYLVTFKKVDPLFVIDLSNHSDPKVLGKLKIPGYSDYLHPIDETHIIGLGKEAIDSGYGDFAWYQGIKMAIFDVSDVANPKEMYKVTIGDRGTDSYALYDHKAFLFNKEKQLLVIPVMLAEISEADKNRSPEEVGWSPAYGESTFQGAFVFNVSLENGISERGRITHVTAEEELKRGYYYSDSYSVKRSFYIDKYLYTMSDSMLKANDLSTLAEISSVPLNTDIPDYGYYYE
ncbi:MAG: beta-propeller domain-containing protein [archaeon]